MVDGKVVIIPILNTAANYSVTWAGVDHWQGTGGLVPAQSPGPVVDVWTFVKLGAEIYGSVAPGV
jgi:hypothetical protein